MKVKIVAVIILIVIISAVVLNTVVLEKQISDLSSKTKRLNENNLSLTEIDALLCDFREKESFMSLTVSHDDLTTIGECIVEIKSSLLQSDNTSAMIAKNRLEYFLEHLRRLSGFNIDSII